MITTSMSASELLGLTRPEDLFPGDLVKAKARYRELSRRWHPDAGGKAEVFAHVSGLYVQACDKLQHGTWEGSAVLNLEDAAGGTRTFTIRASSPFELGRSLVGDDHATYLVDPAHVVIFTKAKLWPASFKYSSPRMREEIERYLPKTPVTWMLADGRLVLQVEKTPDLLRLRDVVTHLGGLDAKHVAWITSGLLNLTCYLSYAGIVHHDISPDTVFISPTHHSVALLGGWWHTCKRGGPVTTVSKRTHGVLPFKVRRDKIASSKTDHELIRLTARECVNGAVPVPMRAWLTGVGTGSAVERYAEWKDVLERSFGPRRFIKLPVDADLVYGAQGVKS